MRENCLYKNPDGHFMEIRLDRLQLCGHDRAAAALMSVFANWTTWKLAQLRQHGKDRDPWVHLSKRELREDLLGVFGESSIERGITVLSGIGVLRTKPPERPCASIWYLFDYRKANELLKAVVEQDVPGPAIHPNRRNGWLATKTPPFGNNAEVNLDFSSTPASAIMPKLSALLPNGTSAIMPTSKKPSLKESRKEPVIHDPSLIPEIQNQPTLEALENLCEAEEATCADLPPSPSHESRIGESPEVVDTETPVAQFVENSYRVRRKRTRWQLGRQNVTMRSDHGRLAEQCAVLESEIGAEIFRSCLQRFLDSEDEWLQGRNYPLAWFLKYWARFDTGEACATDHIPEPAEPATRFADASATTDTPASASHSPRTDFQEYEETEFPDPSLACNSTSHHSSSTDRKYLQNPEDTEQISLPWQRSDMQCAPQQKPNGLYGKSLNRMDTPDLAPETRQIPCALNLPQPEVPISPRMSPCKSGQAASPRHGLPRYDFASGIPASNTSPSFGMSQTSSRTPRKESDGNIYHASRNSNTSSSLPTEAEVWNRVVTAGNPVRDWDRTSKHQKNLARCRESARFTEDWELVCQKAQAVALAQPTGFLASMGNVISKDQHWRDLRDGAKDWLAASDIGRGTKNNGKREYDTAQIIRECEETIAAAAREKAKTA